MNNREIGSALAVSPRYDRIILMNLNFQRPWIGFFSFLDKYWECGRAPNHRQPKVIQIECKEILTFQPGRSPLFSKEKSAINKERWFFFRFFDTFRPKNHKDARKDTRSAPTVAVPAEKKNPQKILEKIIRKILECVLAPERQQGKNKRKTRYYSFDYTGKLGTYLEKENQVHNVQLRWKRNGKKSISSMNDEEGGNSKTTTQRPQPASQSFHGRNRNRIQSPSKSRTGPSFPFEAEPSQPPNRRK